MPWRDLDERSRRWVLDGEPEWVSWSKSWPGTWYGVKRFFAWLESKAYKMHIRVLLSKYRAYTPCEACGGARLKPEALLWRLGTKADSDRVVDAGARFRPRGVAIDDARFARLPGLTIHDLVLLPIDRARDFFAHLTLPAPLDEATDLLLAEIRARLRFLADVGLGYLTLDRQSRTLSGGEVQRINLTTALGTSLVNTLFVLDEPSIGLHPRDMGRVIGVMQRLRDAGNSLRRRRARSAGDARGGPRARHRSRTRRARRRDRVLRLAARARRERAHAHRRLSRRAQARR